MGGPRRTRRLGVARRWRIRHKLMLGLATAIGILALLLAGTLNGLWSYHITTKTVKFRLNELDKAEPLRHLVARLTPPDRIDNPLAYVGELRKKVDAAETALAVFETAFQSTVDEGLSLDDGAHIGGMVSGLRERFGLLREVCVKAAAELS